MNVKIKKPVRAVGRPRTKKPTGRVSAYRKVSNQEAGRIKRAREQLEQHPPGPLPWTGPALSRLEKVLAFLRYLPVTKGKKLDSRMELLPFQVEFLKMIYDADPQPKIAVQSVPRSNGKTGLCAGLVLCHLLGPEAVPRGEVYSAAVTQKQASIIHAEAAAIIRAVPAFSACCAITEQQKRIEVLEGAGKGSIYASLASDAGPALGLAPSLWVYDELGSTKDRRLLDALMSAGGKRKGVLGVIISTQAETDDHHLSELLDNKLPGVVVQLLAAPADADIFDMDVVRACNPAVGAYLDEEDLTAARDRAYESLPQEPGFKRYNLNQRVRSESEDRIVDAATWSRGNVPVNEGALIGKACIGGFDSAAKHDLVVFNAAFEGEDGAVPIVTRVWTPRGQLKNRRPAERTLLEQWEAGGWITFTPGDIVDPAFVFRDLVNFCARYKVARIWHDRSYMDGLRLEMTKAGVALPFEEFGQGFLSMGPALQRLGELLRAGKLHHGGHPVLSYCIGNAVVVTDPAGNQKFHKGRSHSTSKLRVDAAFSLAMSVAPGPALPPPRDFRMMWI